MVSHQVSTGDLAVVLKSGDVPALATPRLIQWFEEACVAVLADELQAQQTSVGMRVNVDHTAPSQVGQLVSARAMLEKVDGRRLTFAVSATDEMGTEIGLGRMVRVIVDRTRFAERLARDVGSPPSPAPDQ